jgi:hypothetical protein
VDTPASDHAEGLGALLGEGEGAVRERLDAARRREQEEALDLDERRLRECCT